MQVASEVPPGEQFRISRRGSTGFTSVSSVRRLLRRKKLLDKGAISRQEFDREKAKVVEQ